MKSEYPVENAHPCAARCTEAAFRGAVGGFECVSVKITGRDPIGQRSCVMGGGRSGGGLSGKQQSGAYGLE